MSTSVSIAESFVAARLQARPLAAYPGELPPDLAEAYRVQESAIARWPDRIAGWKVAIIHPDLRAALGESRLSGPIFAGTLQRVPPQTTAAAPGIRDGLIAVETEIGIIIGDDLPPRTEPWTAAEVAAAVEGMYLAMEIAGSPLPTLNEIGPLAVASDFGNNSGGAIGAEIAGWRDGALDRVATSMRIDGRVVGEGRAIGPNGGPLDALLFLANHLARRGRGLKRGDVVSAGATTGVHDIAIGQVAEACCTGCPPLSVRIVEKRPEPS